MTLWPPASALLLILIGLDEFNFGSILSKEPGHAEALVLFAVKLKLKRPLSIRRYFGWSHWHRLGIRPAPSFALQFHLDG
jgi:hypothetical protein